MRVGGFIFPAIFRSLPSPACSRNKCAVHVSGKWDNDRVNREKRFVLFSFEACFEAIEEISSETATKSCARAETSPQFRYSLPVYILIQNKVNNTQTRFITTHFETARNSGNNENVLVSRAWMWKMLIFGGKYSSFVEQLQLNDQRLTFAWRVGRNQTRWLIYGEITRLASVSLFFVELVRQFSLKYLYARLQPIIENWSSSISKAFADCVMREIELNWIHKLFCCCVCVCDTNKLRGTIQLKRNKKMWSCRLPFLFSRNDSAQDSTLLVVFVYRSPN